MTESSPYTILLFHTGRNGQPLWKIETDGRLLFEEWAKRNKARFTGFVIPNVFGPFGNPFYNSVIATFCYQLTHNEQPKIVTDMPILSLST